MRKLFDRISSLCGLRFFYLVFLKSLACWLYQKHRFRDVESWPWVEAKLVNSAQASIPFRLETRTGSQATTLAMAAVEFTYVVNGVTYKGDLGTPDGGGLQYSKEVAPDGELNWNLRAYYHPNDPASAVLSPEPYWGPLLLAIATTFGIPVLVHLVLWFREKWF